MSEAISALAITTGFFVIALISRAMIGPRIQPSPMPIRLRELVDPIGRGILALTSDPTLHPAVARELRIGLLVSTALRSAGDHESAALLLRETQSVASARSAEAADELGRAARRYFANL